MTRGLTWGPTATRQREQRQAEDDGARHGDFLPFQWTTHRDNLHQVTETTRL
jgi:hypothetical protein